MAFLIDVFQSSKSVFGAAGGSILVQVNERFFSLSIDEAILSGIQSLGDSSPLHSDVHQTTASLLRVSNRRGWEQRFPGEHRSDLTRTTEPLGPFTSVEKVRLGEKGDFPTEGLSSLLRTCSDTYVRQPLYTLLQIGIVRCPLDQRYNTLLFVWYTYIRPWRFGPASDLKATNLLDNTTNDQETSGSEQSLISTENLNFVERNLPFYGRLFQFAIDRLQKTDLTNGLIAQLVLKLANVR